MSWTHETGADGLPVWRGKDGIVNLRREQAAAVLGCGGPAMVILLFLGVAMVVAGSGGSRPVDGLGLIIGIPTLMGVALFFLVLMQAESGGGLSTREFFDEAWTLREIREEGFHGLAFRREASVSRPAASWRAKLSDIERVEVGGTKQWLPSRQIGNMLHEVTPYEQQAFLFMGDGSRRVIYSVNGNLEAVATLAQSVRVWFETRKAQALLARQCTHALPVAERQEGFEV